MSIKNADYYFFKGGGEMGELIRAKDWSKTTLGDPADWPQSLCTMVAVMLNNPFGMYIAWGSEYIQLYNDGYRPILGASKHPQALGISTRETFSEIWHIIESMFDGVMNGKAVGFPDFMLPLNRNGYVEECYFDFSYSPIKKNDGEVGGVLVTVIETTNKKKAEESLKESNQRFRNTMKQAPVGITILRGPQYIVEMANDAYLQLVDKKEVEFVGNSLFVSLPEAEDAVHSLLDNVLNTGTPYHGNEVPIPVNRYGKQGIFYFDFVYHPLKEEDGKISGVIVVVTEVTEKVATRKKIEESEQRFQAAIEAVEGILWTNNGKGEMEGEQPGWAALTGQTYQEYQGHGWAKAVHPDDAQSTVNAWNKAVQERKVFVFEHQIKKKNEGYRYFSIRAIPLLNPDGGLRQWVGVHSDIQDQKIREEKKDEFISIASHEMKTPLTTAKAYLQMLELSLEGNDEDSNLFAKKASQSVNRLNELVSELLDVSKIRLGKLNYTITTFNFNEMIENTVENIQLTSQTHTIVKTGKVNNVVTGDKDRLKQVVINLLNNAIKYSPAADTVFINIEQEKDIIKVSVKDTGIGVSRQSLNKIFEKYHRIEEHAVHFQGLGIGLFISYEIIQRHHGKLWAESEVGKGSTFYFTIPLSIASPQ